MPEPWGFLSTGCERTAVVIILQTGPRHGKVSGAVQSYEGIMGRFKDITGQRFGLWTVLKRDITIRGKIFWKCACDCGVVRIVGGEYLRSGKSTSCGCKRNAQIRSVRIRHGESDTPLYVVWKGMVYRKRKNNAQVPICEEWKEYFNFAEWARLHGYRKGLFLSRIDMGKGWYPENACFRLKRNPRNKRISKYPAIPKIRNGKRHGKKSVD